MSMPMSNLNQGGYDPTSPGNYQAGNPPPGNYQPVAPPPANYKQQGFVPGQQQGYAPVSQQIPNGEAPFDAGQQSYEGPTPGYDGQPQYGGGPKRQAPYGGGQPQEYNGRGFQPGNEPPQAPIMSQPGVPMKPDQPMGPAGISTNCPRGLEYLTTVDQLLVEQKVELLEAFTGFETNNKFSIKNALGQNVYYAVEDTDCCTRNVCGPSRPFDMKIFDNFRNEVIHVYRPLACSCCLFPCCLQSMEVTAPPGNVIGTIEQEWTICAPAFSIKNNIGDTVLRIEGPVCTFSMCGDVEFNVLSLTGENIGKICKQWSGLARELFTDADVFGITFPLDLDVHMKAVLLGATFLIDAMFFESSDN